MVKRSTLSALALLVGDIIILALALWAALWVRYWNQPSSELFLSHFYPFAYIFVIWVVVYFIYDLYRTQISFFHQRLISILFNAHIINSVIAILFFYFVPFFGITPKTNMFIFLFVSIGLMVIWRAYLVPKIFRHKPETIVFACQGDEVDELSAQFRQNPKHNIQICEPVASSAEVKSKYPHASLVAISTYGQDVSTLTGWYDFLFSGMRFVSVERLYEDLFGRIPVSLISERWFLEHISTEQKPVYEFLKRFIDIFVGLLIGLVFLVLLPVVVVVVKLSDGGKVFFSQYRVGQGGKPFKLYKFRSMDRGQVTFVGRFLRSSRIDELPQFWNLIKGDVSLVGPRPELVEYVEKYRAEIPYYDIRHLTKPGLSGWAQIYHENHPHFNPESVATREKLSYDLYYIKNRSLILDLTIIIKTARILLSRSGK